ncbi:MAG: DNA repair ATPase, partial [Psychrosphaera sp.]|nr:DNA repair ATPase [Psychrosphaera sp.]
MSEEKTPSLTEQAVAQGGAYEVIRNRLSKHGASLESQTGQVNQSRQAEFGSTEMALLSRLRLRTENNCEARDLVLVSDYVMFGYNAFLGLRNETKVEDVFGLFKLVQNEGEYDVEEVSFKGTFLADQQFLGDFRELYSYYKDTALSQLVVKDNKLLAAFQIGERLSDIRVFRWNISADGKTIEYIDNRGERDIALPPKYDFEWQRCPRHNVIEGRYPHINILDTLFVDTLRGDLTVKVENNTQSG